MYFYPMYVADELIDTIAASRKIVPYLDMPLQHINDTMLQADERRVTRGETEELLGRLRSRITDLALRTTFITGFPGETDERVRASWSSSSQKQRFERLGVFTYSLEPDTPAAKLPDHVPAEVMEAAPRAADGGAAGDRLRLERARRSAARSTCSSISRWQARRTSGSAAAPPTRRTSTAWSSSPATSTSCEPATSCRSRSWRRRNTTWWAWRRESRGRGRSTSSRSRLGDCAGIMSVEESRIRGGIAMSTVTIDPATGSQVRAQPKPSVEVCDRGRQARWVYYTPMRERRRRRTMNGRMQQFTKEEIEASLKSGPGRPARGDSSPNFDASTAHEVHGRKRRRLRISSWPISGWRRLTGRPWRRLQSTSNRLLRHDRTHRQGRLHPSGWRVLADAAAGRHVSR